MTLVPGGLSASGGLEPAGLFKINRVPYVPWPFTIRLSRLNLQPLRLKPPAAYVLLPFFQWLSTIVPACASGSVRSVGPS